MFCLLSFGTYSCLILTDCFSVLGKSPLSSSLEGIVLCRRCHVDPRSRIPLTSRMRCICNMGVGGAGAPLGCTAVCGMGWAGLISGLAMMHSCTGCAGVILCDFLNKKDFNCGKIGITKFNIFSIFKCTV